MCAKKMAIKEKTGFATERKLSMKNASDISIIDSVTSVRIAVGYGFKYLLRTYFKTGKSKRIPLAILLYN